MAPLHLRCCARFSAAALAMAPQLLLPAAQAQSAAGHGPTGAVPALYATQAEAERAARLHFQCQGAHRMGQQWMPCAQHSPDASHGPDHSH